jgi:chaperonin GroES
MKPIHDKIIIKPRPAANRTKAGIMLDTLSKPKYDLADVVSVGERVKDVKAGDLINFDTHAAMILDKKKNEFMIREIDVEYVILS